MRQQVTLSSYRQRYNRTYVELKLVCGYAADEAVEAIIVLM